MNNLTVKSIDIMKKTLDAVNGQLTTGEKTALIACIATTGATHVAMEVPMDTNADFVTNGNTPSTRTVEAEIQEWFDIIHAAGLNVMQRAAFCGMDVSSNYGFPWRDYNGGSAISVGTHTSATSDGETTWCGKLRRFILTNVGSHWANGDIFAPIYEGTSHAFDGHTWWTNGDTSGYATAFIEFHATASAAFTTLGKTVSFQSHNNFSEVRSGWLPTSVFTDQNLMGFDYYGQDSGGGLNDVSDYLSDLNTQYNAKLKPMSWGEWGDILGTALPSRYAATIEGRLTWLIRFYKMLRDNFVDTGKLTTFNYWGGWEGQNTSLFYKTGSGASSVYSLNARGKILASFFKNSGGSVRIPVVTRGSTDDTYAY